MKMIIYSLVLALVDSLQAITLLSPSPDQSFEAGAVVAVKWMAEPHHIGRTGILIIQLIDKNDPFAGIMLYKGIYIVPDDGWCAMEKELPAESKPGAYRLTVSESMPGDLPGANTYAQTTIHISAPHAPPDRAELIATGFPRENLRTPCDFTDGLFVKLVPYLSENGLFGGFLVVCIADSPQIIDNILFRLQVLESGTVVKQLATYSIRINTRLVAIALERPLPIEARRTYDFVLQLSVPVPAAGTIRLGLAQEQITLGESFGKPVANQTLPSVTVDNRAVPVSVESGKSAAVITVYKQQAILFRAELVLGETYAIEHSINLREWQPVHTFQAQISEWKYLWSFAVTQNSYEFMRLRWVPKQPAQ